MAKFAKRALWPLIIVILAVIAGKIVVDVNASMQEMAAESANYIVAGETVPLAAFSVSEEPKSPSLKPAGVPNEFSDEEKTIYKTVSQGLFEMREKIEFVSTIEHDEIEKILRRAYDAPDYFWLSGMKWTHTKNESGLTEYCVMPEYMMSQNERDQVQLTVDAVVSRILESADSPESVAKAVVEWLNIHTEYDHNEETQTTRARAGIAGAFVDGKIVCSGYSRAVAYSLLRAGYPSAYCVGTTADGTLHAWNAYEDSYGRTVYLDATYACGGKLPFGLLTSYLDMDEEMLSKREIESETWYSPTENNI